MALTEAAADPLPIVSHPAGSCPKTLNDQTLTEEMTPTQITNA